MTVYRFNGLAVEKVFEKVSADITAADVQVDFVYTFNEAVKWVVEAESEMMCAREMVKEAEKKVNEAEKKVKEAVKEMKGQQLYIVDNSALTNNNKPFENCSVLVDEIFSNKRENTLEEWLKIEGMLPDCTDVAGSRLLERKQLFETLKRECKRFKRE